MKYINTNSENVLTLDAIRKLHPNMSIPDGADLSEIGYAEVHEGEYPSFSPNMIVSEGPIVNIGGEWFTTYTQTQIQTQTENMVPHSVTMGQARLALFDLGKLNDVLFILNSLPEPQKQRALIEWEYRPTVDRDSALVLQLGQALNLDLDALFIAAEAL